MRAIQSDAGRPLFKIAFNYVNYHPFTALAETSGIELLDFEVNEQTNFALLATVGIDPRTRRLFLRVTGDAHGVTATQAHEYASAFIQVLSAIARTPEQAIDLGTNELIAREVTQLISEQPAMKPDKIAVVGAPDRSSAVPRTPAQKVLVDVFASVLGVDTIGVHDNFFTIGGDSILALVARSKAEKRGVAFEIEELFARPTVAELAESCSRPAPEPEGITEPFALLPLIDRAALHEAEDAFPATTLQLGMLFHSIERAESTMYKDVFRYRVAMPWSKRSSSTRSMIWSNGIRHCGPRSS